MGFHRLWGIRLANHFLISVFTLLDCFSQNGPAGIFKTRGERVFKWLVMSSVMSYAVWGPMGSL